MKLLHLFLTLFTAVLFLSCSSDKETLQVDTNLTVYAGDIVKLHASGAKAYSWKQLSGTDVILVDANSATASFIAPSVTQQESLVFELTALHTKETKIKATVTILPLQQEDTNISDDTNTTTLQSLKLTLKKNSLNIETNTTLSVIATYDNNSSKDVTAEVEWIYTDNLAISIQNHTLKTNHKDTNIILQVKLATITSNPVALEIYKEINGHRLPPEPDQTINNSTLLGIDSNNNGVRDDVERKIYAVYKRPIEQAYMMQYAVRYPKVLENPLEAAKSEELEKEHWNLHSCKGYLRKEKIILPTDNVSFMENTYFNTKERMRAYIEFNDAMSGGVYNIPLPRDADEKNCDFNITKILELEKSLVPIVPDGNAYN